MHWGNMTRYSSPRSPGSTRLLIDMSTSAPRSARAPAFPGRLAQALPRSVCAPRCTEPFNRSGHSCVQMSGLTDERSLRATDGPSAFALTGTRAARGLQFARARMERSCTTPSRSGWRFLTAGRPMAVCTFLALVLDRPGALGCGPHTQCVEMCRSSETPGCPASADDAGGLPSDQPRSWGRETSCSS